VRDLACVPTGITKYREGLFPISDVDGEYSKKLLDLVDELNAEFGVNFLLPADEYFVKAGRPFKEESFYGDFEQIENGIGMTSKFLSEARFALDELPTSFALPTAKKSLIISGVSATEINRQLAEECANKIGKLSVDVLPVVNDFFGPTVTCTGLLTGRDICLAVEQYRQNGHTMDEIILPGNTLKEFEDVFLCGMTLDELKEKLQFKNIRINREGGYGFVDILSTIDERI
jgi:NifB/MoaA-like Fe-S oxidoreductase